MDAKQREEVRSGERKAVSQPRKGRVYEPAYDQVPVSTFDRYLRRLQNAVLLQPDNPKVRRRYYDVLNSRGVPQETPADLDLTRVIRDSVSFVSFVKRTRVQVWAERITRFLYWVCWYR